MTLTQTLRRKKEIDTVLGKFSFIKNIGEGGNSEVFSFEKTTLNHSQKFAIKFLKNDFSSSQLARFKDEFFCIQQIGDHPNIAKYYNLDKIKIDENEYYILIMKHYDKSLNEMGSVASLTGEKERSEKLVKLFGDLCKGLKHLHSADVIHRDIKPQNIFWDSETENYVLGDMGIARFPENFVKEAETHKSERLANWSFSPKEHLNSKKPFEKNGDIYSLGQVLNWYMLNKVVGGTNRDRFANTDSSIAVKDIDKIVDKCVNDSPELRFQSITEIKNFLDEMHQKRSERNEVDIWNVIHSFDDIIRKNFTKIRSIEETSDLNKINNFFNDFNKCHPEEFWIMNANGGDNTAKPIERLDHNLWLIWGTIEIKIEKVIVYINETSPYRSFFIILTQPNDKFIYTNSDGQLEESQYSSSMELANYWIEESVYINHDDVRNGYLELSNGVTIEAPNNEFPERQRLYKPYAYMISFKGTPIQMANREVSEKLIKAALDNKSLSIDDIRKYEDQTRGDVSYDIMQWT